MSQTALKQAQRFRCAIYTRKSSEEGLEQSFNSLHAQREACEAYIKSQQHEGWQLIPTDFDDGGFSGGKMDRPALNRLMSTIKQGQVDIIVVYKVDRLSRSLADFARMVELFDRHGVSFVSVTQQFNTSTSMGRLTLNVLLSFAQFEREVTGERIRDKIAASKQKGMWMGGIVPLGYDIKDRALIINEDEATTVRHIYNRYLELGCVRKLKQELDTNSVVSKVRQIKGRTSGGKSFSRGALYTLLKNPTYIGKVSHLGKLYPGQHQAILDIDLWEAVQQQLTFNQQRKVLRTESKVPSLLAGRLFDDRGNPMSPTHATKKSRRYRYYISQALPQYREHEAGSVVRISAQVIEDAVITRLKALLQNGNELLEQIALDALTARHHEELITKAIILAGDWGGFSPSQQINLLKLVINRISIGTHTVSITFSRSGLIETLLPNVAGEIQKNSHHSEDSFVISLPVTLKRSGIEMKLIIPNGEIATAHPSSVEAIQKALSKALSWNQALVTGSTPSMTCLAKENNVTQRYIAHLIKLAFLAPDIMVAIIKGDIPSDLSLDRLKKGFPLDWKEQRKTLGFPAR